MTNLQSQKSGELGDDEYNWLVSRAKAGFDVVISCASHVSKSGQGWLGELACYEDRFVPGLKKLAKGLHQYDCLGIVQIFHAGYFADQELVRPRLSASEVRLVDHIPAAKAMSEAEIELVIDDFVKAAQRIEKAGWDGVEIHAANGYLFSQFLGKRSNTRTDKWGGSLENRFRLLNETIKRVKANTIDNFIVGVRLSPQDSESRPVGIEFNETLELITKLEDLNVSYIHLSAWDVFKKDNDGECIVSKVKKAIENKTPLMAAGEIWTQAQAQKAHELGIDIVAIGKAAITTPDWPIRVYKNGDNPEFTPVTEAHLKSAHLGPDFIKYMSRWPGFLK